MHSFREEKPYFGFMSASIEAHKEVQYLLRGLSPTQRAIVERKHLSGAATDPEKITYRQIAEEMNSRWARSRVRLPERWRRCASNTPRGEQELTAWPWRSWDEGGNEQWR